MGKHHLVPYPLRVNKRADHPFELVYSDIWGPCLVSSTLVYKYFIIFVDDFFSCDIVIFNEKLFSLSPFFKLYVMKSRINLVCLFILCGLITRKNFLVHLLCISCLVLELVTKFLVLTLHNRTWWLNVRIITFLR